MNNGNSVIFFHTQPTHNLLDILSVCKNLNLNTFECSSLANLFETTKLLRPAFVVIEQQTLTQDEFLCFCQAHKDIFIFVLGEFQVFDKNTIFCNNIKDFEIKLKNLYLRIDKNSTSITDTSHCNNFITFELEKLNFSIKHIGFHYIKEVIIQLYKSSSSIHCCLKNVYPYLSIKFNCNSNTIERAIRFAISKAYNKSKEKENPPFIFSTHPTVKQLTSYLLDKFLSSIA